MNPIPLTWCLAGAGVALLLGGLGGWTVCDWRHDSKTVAAVAKAAKDLDQARGTIDRAATAYEQEKPVADAQSTVRESTIREIYKDRPVNVDCAAPAAAVGLLNDAIAAANARATGQPGATVRTPASTAAPATGP
jgi:hypothetical protein